MNDTLLRHWRMLREIPRYPRRIITSTLVERLREAGFETTQRTVQRDLIKFSTVLPLVSDDAKPQGWSWEANALQLDLPALEPQAALVFHLAERHLRSLLPASTLNYLSPWFNTADGVLDHQGNGLSEWRSKVRVLAPGQPLQAPVVDPEVQATITQALLENRQIAVTYRPRNAKEDKEYVAHPLSLVVRDQSLYLICTLWDYTDIKQLLLHRMQSAQLLNEQAKRLKNFNVDNYITQGELGLPAVSGTKIDLVADFARNAAVTLIERPMARGQTLEEIDEDTIRFKATVPDTAELRWWLLGFGDKAEVLAPASLRNEMAITVANLGRRYQAGHEKH